MSIPPPRSSTKAAVGLGSAYYFHNTKPDTHKELISYSLNDSANETYCETPRQGEIIQPLLNWSEHSPHEGFMEGPEMYRNTVGKTRSQGLKGNGLIPILFAVWSQRATLRQLGWVCCDLFLVCVLSFTQNDLNPFIYFNVEALASWYMLAIPVFRGLRQ